jgi:hypothetical protein
MANLIQRQEACIARMLEPRTSEKRAAKNRSAALRAYRKQCVSVGYSDQDIDRMVKDIKDMVALEINAEGA